MPLDAVTVSLALVAASVFVKQVLVPEIQAYHAEGAVKAKAEAKAKAKALAAKKQKLQETEQQKQQKNITVIEGKDGLPPSPPSDPIIGNARVMPLEYAWKTFASWSKTYGAFLVSLTRRRCISGINIVLY